MLKVGAYQFGLGDYKKMEAKLKKLKLAEEAKPIVDYLVKGEMTFADQEDFEEALNYLVACWGAQRIFYGKENFVEWKAAAGAPPPTLYSGRPLEQATALYHWAKAKGIPVTVVGVDPFIASADPESAAPFKGHFGDRVQTLKHMKQKQAGGAVCLVGIELNKEGSRALRGVQKIEKGGEGYVKGKFGLKHEKESISVAIGDTVQTWDFLANTIEGITLMT
jgi:hypothetical protein